MTDLRQDLDAVRRALVVGADLLPESLRTSSTSLLQQVETRLGHLGPTVVVALAGGTGSGKSSLVNALAGSDVVEVGVLRPTTQRPIAVLPADVENSLLTLLHELDITDVRRGGSTPHLAVIDLPDIDSVQLEHRALVDDLVPRVDAVVWVLDPTKYNDALVHDAYLRPMRRHEEQFLVVVNQVDRLTAQEQEDVVADLRATLARDGFRDLPVLAVAADPARGEPIGVDALTRTIEERFRAKQAALGRLRTQVDELVDELRDVAGDPHDLPSRTEVFDEAAAMIAAGIIDEPEIGRAGDIGAATAHRVAWGPIGGLLSSVRGSAVGRAVGLRGDALLEDRILPTASRPTSRLGPSVLLQDWTTDVSLELGEPLGRRVRVTVGDVDDVVSRAVTESRQSVSGLLRVEPRTWWRVAGVVRVLAVLAVVAAGVAVWSDPGLLTPGRLPVPVLVVAVAIALVVGLGRVARSSGREAGEAAATAQRSAIAQAARGSLDFHLGRPIDDVLAVRDDLREALPAP